LRVSKIIIRDLDPIHSMVWVHHQVFSIGRHATPEDRAKATKSANRKKSMPGEQGPQGVEAL